MKKLYLKLSVLLVVIVLISCDNFTIPTEFKNGNTCDTLPSWLLESVRPYYSLREVTAVSIYQNYIFFASANVLVIFSKSSNSKTFIPVNEITINDDFQFYEKMSILPCPYDNNKVMVIVNGYNNESKRIRHWYLFDLITYTSVKITPSQYRDMGLNDSTYSWLSDPGAWMTSSSEGNDYFHNEFGIYHLQKEVYLEKISEDITIVSVSPNGKYKWYGYNKVKFGDKEKSGWFLSGKKIEGIELHHTSLLTHQLNTIRWSSDSKYIATVVDTDLRTTFYPLPELHIINVEKTYNTGKLVIDKSINLRDFYCVFRCGLFAQYTTNNTVLLSMSYNQSDEGILYEIDVNTGKQTPLIYD